MPCSLAHLTEASLPSIPLSPNPPGTIIASKSWASNFASEFSGLKPGDKWCLCAERWKEAYVNGKAPPVYLESTHKRTLEIIDFNLLQKFAVN